MSTIAHFVASFREAAPYIQYLRGKTMVVGVTDSLLEGETLIRLAADLNLLASLGLRLVLVHGSRHLLDKLASGRNFVPKYSGSRRITDEATLMEVKQVAGIIRSDVEALCSAAYLRSNGASRRLSRAATLLPPVRWALSTAWTWAIPVPSAKSTRKKSVCVWMAVPWCLSVLWDIRTAAKPSI